MWYTNALLMLVAFLDLLAVGLIIPLVPNHVRDMGGNEICIGLLGSIYAIFQLGSGPFIGSLSDIKGRKIILILTLLVCSAAYLTIGFTNSIAVILLLRAVLGLFKQTQLLTKALIPDYEKDEKVQSKIYGKMAAISGMGISLGPVIGGHIYEDFPQKGFTYIGVVVSLFFIINAVLIYYLPNINIGVNKTNKTKTRSESKNILKSLIDSTKQSFAELSKVEWSRYGIVFIFQAANSFAMGVYYSSYSFYLKTWFGLSPKSIGYVVSVQGLICAVSSFLIGYINSFYKNDHDYSQRNFHIFILLSASLLGICLSHNIILYTILLVPLATGNAVGRLVTLEMVLKRSHGDHRGTLIGASNSVRSLSGVIAPIVAGTVGEMLGVQFVMYIPFVSCVVGLVMSYKYKNRHVKMD